MAFGMKNSAASAMVCKVEALKAEALAELAKIEAMGGAVAAVDSGYMKSALVASNTARLEGIERGQQIVVGVNKFREAEASPLTTGDDQIMVVPKHVEAEQIAALNAWRTARDAKAVSAALKALHQAAVEGSNIMPPSIAAAKAGVTTGEWGAALREVWGEYRAPTGVSAQARQGDHGLDGLRAEVERVSLKLGRRIKFIVGKPGLDGHSNGAEQIAVRARDIGMDVTYAGIRFTPAEIVAAAKTENAHCIGLSILSGSHIALVRDVLAQIKAAKLETKLVVGGIIPQDDAEQLLLEGVSAVYTPKDFEMNRIMSDIIGIIEANQA